MPKGKVSLSDSESEIPSPRQEDLENRSESLKTPLKVKQASAVGDTQKKEQLSAVSDNQEKVGDKQDAGADANAVYYEFDNVLDHRRDDDGTDHYLIQWKGYSEPSWTPKENFLESSETTEWLSVARAKAAKRRRGEKDSSAVGDNKNANRSENESSGVGDNNATASPLDFSHFAPDSKL